MTLDSVQQLSADVFKVILLVAAPALLVSLVVGLLVSIFQAVTQIQEFTLTFIPKIIAVFVTIYVLFPWYTRVLMSFTTDLMERMPEMIR